MRATLIALSALLPSTAMAWPGASDWLPVQQNGVNMTDPVADHRHTDVTLGDHLDFVGDSNDLVFQWWADMNNLFVRIRLNENPWTGATQTQLQKGSWAIGFDLDGDTTTFEYAISQNGPNTNMNLWEVDFSQSGVNAELTLVSGLAANEAIAQLSQATSNLGGDTDWLMDVKISWSLLETEVGITKDSPFGLIAMSEDEYIADQYEVDLVGHDDSSGLGSVADGRTDDLAWDSDGDELSNAFELNAGTDPFDGDTDDDGLSDYEELNGVGSDPLSCDTDQDGLPDGLEIGLPAEHADTDLSQGCFIADSDPGTISNPLEADTDFGSASDGVEDWNSNGAQDPFEGDLQNPNDDGDEDGDGVPNFAEDDCPDDSGNIDDEDSDADTLNDADEGWTDTDGDGFPDFCDTDSDGDGIPDSQEGAEDTDGDGIPNYRDTDSDDDGIPDAEESDVGDSDCDGIPDVLDQTNDDMCDSNQDSGIPGNFEGLGDGKFSGGACSSTSTSAAFLPALLALVLLALRRRPALVALIVPGIASADGLEQDADSLPVNAQRFRAAPDSVFYSLQDGHVGPAAQGGANLLFNHASSPLVYRFADPDKEDYALLGSVSTTDLVGWYNLPGIRLAAVLPIHLASSGHQVEGFRAIGDIRFLATWAALQTNALRVSTSADLSLPTGNEETWLGDESSVGELSIQASWTSPKLLAVGHLGYRLHFNDVPLSLDTNWGNRFSVGVGLAYSISDTMAITWENTGEFLSRVADNAEGGHNAPLESLAGFRYRFLDGLEVSVGAGAGLTDGVGSPDWRGVAGLTWQRSKSFADPAPPAVQPAGIPQLPTETSSPEPSVPTGWVRVVAVNEGGMPVRCSVRVLGTGKPPIKGGDDGWTELELPAGNHEIVVWSEGYHSFHTDIEVSEDSKTNIEVTLPGGKVAIEGDQVRVFEKVFFELDSTEIKQVSFSLLDEVVELLLNHPEITLMSIEGHTDDQGDAQYNIDLSFGRAEAVVHYLTAQGVERDRLEARGHGESKPLLQGESADARAANRRVEFHIQRRVPETP